MEVVLGIFGQQHAVGDLREVNCVNLFVSHYVNMACVLSEEGNALFHQLLLLEFPLGFLLPPELLFRFKDISDLLLHFQYGPES
jgi:hypothetical protein